MNNQLERFEFKLYNIAICPNCDNSSLSVDSATNKSVMIRCSTCKKEWFYRIVNK